MKFAGWFGITVGVLMLAMWSVFLASGQVPELQTEPYRISFHLAAEFTTAISLIVAGAGLLRKRTWARSFYLFVAGMVLYSLIVSPGYYAQLGQWGFVAMFAVLVMLTLASVFKVTGGKAG